MAAAHVVPSDGALLFELGLVLLVLGSGLVEDRRTEVVQRTLIIVHHHVAPASLIVCHGELCKIITHRQLNQNEDNLV